jgi:hypothetical protein
MNISVTNWAGHGCSDNLAQAGGLTDRAPASVFPNACLCAMDRTRAQPAISSRSERWAPFASSLRRCFERCRISSKRTDSISKPAPTTAPAISKILIMAIPLPVPQYIPMRESRPGGFMRIAHLRRDCLCFNSLAFPPP